MWLLILGVFPRSHNPIRRLQILIQTGFVLENCRLKQWLQYLLRLLTQVATIAHDTVCLARHLRQIHLILTQLLTLLLPTELLLQQPRIRLVLLHLHLLARL